MNALSKCVSAAKEETAPVRPPSPHWRRSERLLVTSAPGEEGSVSRPRAMTAGTMTRPTRPRDKPLQRGATVADGIGKTNDAQPPKHVLPSLPKKATQVPQK